MAAPTITVDRYHELVFAPKSTAVKADASQLDNMKFDSQHYERYYTLCRGAGGDHEKCKDIPVDEHITPQNPTVQHFQKQIFDGVDCMNDHGDINKCLHHTEFVRIQFLRFFVFSFTEAAS